MNLPPPLQTQVVDRSDAKVINMVREQRVSKSIDFQREDSVKVNTLSRAVLQHSSLEAFSENDFFSFS